MKNILKFLVVFMIVAVSCEKSPEKVEATSFAQAVEQIKVDGKYKWIAVLPGLGCHGCIQEAEAFMSGHVADERILFVLTKVSSLKILQQKTGINFDEHTNIFVDRDNLFQISTNNAIYPCVIQLNNGEYLKHSFQNPSNEAFRQLREQL
ncbi:MAG: hypothetical protein LBV47_01115 [Bacteroidales bacterium]|jgi:hypothetical protein|nr:hypothetical protein [Bacteroidales bacterium]